MVSRYHGIIGIIHVSPGDGFDRARALSYILSPPGILILQSQCPQSINPTPTGFNLHNLYALSNKSIHSVLPLQDSDNITYIPESVLPPPLTYTQKIPWYHDTLIPLQQRGNIQFVEIQAILRPQS